MKNLYLPWHMDEHGDIYDKNNFLVAHIPAVSPLKDWAKTYFDIHQKPGHSCIERTEEEHAAACRLLAAAPNMLKALQDYNKMYEIVEPAGGWQGTYEEGRSAIKEATI